MCCAWAGFRGRDALCPLIETKCRQVAERSRCGCIRFCGGPVGRTCPCSRADQHRTLVSRMTRMDSRTAALKTQLRRWAARTEATSASIAASKAVGERSALRAIEVGVRQRPTRWRISVSFAAAWQRCQSGCWSSRAASPSCAPAMRATSAMSRPSSSATRDASSWASSWRTTWRWVLAAPRASPWASPSS